MSKHFSCNRSVQEWLKILGPSKTKNYPKTVMFSELANDVVLKLKSRDRNLNFDNYQVGATRDIYWFLSP